MNLKSFRSIVDKPSYSEDSSVSAQTFCFVPLAVWNGLLEGSRSMCNKPSNAVSHRRIWKCVVCLFSSEWVLTGLRWPNGSEAILLRSVISSILLFMLVLLTLNVIDPSRTWQPSFAELRIQVSGRTGWLGMIFAAVYTALYAKFSSQWTYLANLYNQIKQVETSTQFADPDALAEWKAGFIEDAENLHLACKGSFVSVIKAWTSEESVKEKYVKHTPGGEERFGLLVGQVESSATRVEKGFKRISSQGCFLVRKRMRCLAEHDIRR